jgi:hypothetical protein
MVREPSPGPAVPVLSDTVGNYPPLYPDFTGSGSVDPTGAQWPGYQIGNFVATGAYPGATVETGYGPAPTDYPAGAI